jgi:hypothetical protein
MEAEICFHVSRETEPVKPFLSGDKMAEEIKNWEYRVQTIGGVFGTKDEHIQATLNEWGSEGWEAINVFTPEGSGKITIVAKRPLTDRARRLRSMPLQ